MPDTTRTYGRYLGEGPWAPIVTTAVADPDDTPEQRKAVGLTATPAVEKHFWSADGLDWLPGRERRLHRAGDLHLGITPRHRHTATWLEDGCTAVQAVEIPDGTGVQDVLLVDPRWVDQRLAELGRDLVIGSLSDRLAQDPHVIETTAADAPHSDDKVARAHVSYVALLRAGEQLEVSGPRLEREDDLR